MLGEDPASSPMSQLRLGPCDGSEGVGGVWYLEGSTGRLSLAAGTFGISRPCLAGVTQPMLDLFSRDMENGDLALALLNRGATRQEGVMILLAELGYAPAQRVIVRDVWAKETKTVMGSYTTRAMDTHETILLRLSLE